MAEIALRRRSIGGLHISWAALTPTTVLGMTITLGAFVRFFALAHQSVWLDEADSVFLARRSPSFIVHFLSVNDSHPPLYYLLLHCWMRLFSQSEVSIRSLSAICGAASIYVTYKLARELFDEETGAMAALVVATSSLLIWYSQEARMYALLFLIVAIASYCLVQALRGEGRGWWAGYALATAAALYTDNGGIWFLMASCAWLAVQGWRDKELRLPALVSLLAVTALYAPWLPSFWHQSQSVTQSFWLSPPTYSTVLDTFVSFNGYNLPVDALNIVYLTAILLWFHLLPGKYVQRRGLVSTWLFLPIIVSYALSLRQPIFLLRNLIACSLAYYVLVAKAAWSFESRKMAFAVVAPLLMINGFAFVHNYVSEKKEQWRDAAAYVAAHASSNEMLIFDAGYTEMPFRYYDTTGLPGRGFPGDEGLVHDNAQALSDVGQAVSGKSGVWLVLSHTPEVDGGNTVQAWFKAHATEKDHKGFSGIDLYEYQLGGSAGQKGPTGR